jgi:HKD family nuclease
LKIVGIVDNEGDNTLLGVFRTILKGSDEIRLAVAYMDNRSVRELVDMLTPIMRSQHKATVQILVRASHDLPNHPRAYERLFRLQSKYPEQCSVCISSIDGFHWKLYMARKSETVTVLVGSSNLLSKELTQPGDLNVWLEGKCSDTSAKQFTTQFRNQWKKSSRNTLTAKFARRYKQLYESKQKSTVISRKKWNAALGLTRTKPGPGIAWRAWYDETDRDASSSAKKRVKQDTNWDRKGWSWYHRGKGDVFFDSEDGDRVLVWDHQDNRLYVGIIRSRTKLGRISYPYAIAYDIRRTPRMTEKVVSELKSLRHRLLDESDMANLRHSGVKIG